MEDVIIIGAGASGLACGIELGKRNILCLVLEGKEKAGKKIYASGNGKCNLGNRNVSSNNYHSIEPLAKEQLAQIISDKTDVSVERFFNGIGILLTERNGYLYPHSEQAGSVVHAMEQALVGLGGRIQCDAYVNAVTWKKEKQVFQVQTPERNYQCKRLVLATGGMASPQHGSDGSGYRLAKSLGHSVTPCFPSLCGIRVSEQGFQKLQGVRAKGCVTIYIANKPIASEQGELQFTQYGLSGIAVFNVSRYVGIALAGHEPVSVQLDLCTGYSEEELLQHLFSLQTACEYQTIGFVLAGIIPEKLSLYFLKKLGISQEATLKGMKRKELHQLVHILKNYRVTISGINNMEQAQVTVGGIPLKEINPDTMESNIQKSFYLTGEVLDADGCCGGYNLMWAWETGRRAGQKIV